MHGNGLKVFFNQETSEPPLERGGKHASFWKKKAWEVVKNVLVLMAQSFFGFIYFAFFRFSHGFKR